MQNITPVRASQSQAPPTVGLPAREIAPETASPSPSLAPLIKWPGGKRWLAAEVARLGAGHAARFIEPFCGGAAAFFFLRPQRALLCDLNADLINAYQVVAEKPESVISALQSLSNCAATYYKVRASHPKAPLSQAVRFLYLTRLSFNGIYRVNLDGEFNVPYGWKQTLPVVEPEHLRRCAEALSNATLVAQDFRTTFEMAEAQDFIYADPPYTVAHNNNGFVKYNERIFCWEDQIALADAALRAVNRGVQVVVSNAVHRDLQALYPSFQYRKVERYSSVSALASGRRRVSESLLVGGVA